MKKGLLCTLMLTGAMSVSAFAAPAMSVDGTAIEQSETMEIEGNDYFPVRPVAEAMGLSVEWQGETKTVVLTNGGPLYITFSIGENGYTFAKTAPMPSVGAPVIVDGRTYIPVDVISDIAGIMVEKNDESYNITLAQNETDKTDSAEGFGELTPYATGIVKEVNDEQILFTDDKRGDVILTKGGDVKVTDSEGNSLEISDIKAEDKLTVEYGDAMTMSIPPINNPKSIVVEK